MVKKFGIIGRPLRHSLSPRLFQEIFRRRNLNFTYIPFEISAFQIRPLLDSLKMEAFNGLNVTIPFKELILAFLDEVEDKARKIGAVNTVHFEGDRLFGFNTDVHGFQESIKEYKEKIKTAIILGGGGGGRAVFSGLTELGCLEIFMAVRHPGRKERILKDFSSFPHLKILEWNEEAILSPMKKTDLVVNATPLGIDGWSSPVYPNFSLKGKVFFDLIYNPPLTPFLAHAKAKGAEIKNGRDMLIFQAIKAFEIWTGIRTEKREWEEAYDSVIENQEVP